MTDDDKELVDRLRWVSEWYFVDPVDGAAYASDDPLDAADRIEALIAESERLREALTLCAKHVDWMPHPHCVEVETAIRAALGETK